MPIHYITSARSPESPRLDYSICHPNIPFYSWAEISRDMPSTRWSTVTCRACAIARTQHVETLRQASSGAIAYLPLEKARRHPA